MRYPLIVLVGIFTSFFLFPTAFAFLPSVNTKILMALMGIMIAAYKNSTGGGGMVSKHIIELTGYAGMFSLTCLIAVVYNNTSDYAYATYFVSMWVWAMAAYAVCQWIRHVHGEVTFELATRYLVGVCVAQCLIAMQLDRNPGLESFVNSIFFTGSDYFKEGGRLYGIGCALDPAGVRFSIILVLLSNLIISDKTKSSIKMFLYMLAFVIIVIYGNMIARTTTVGVFVSLAYLMMSNFTEKHVDSRVWKWFLIVILFTIPLMTVQYNTDPTMHKNLRFGFEGFFSLAEKGRWESGSNDALKNMLVWPDNMKTWIIGDGYFDSPRNTNPYYIGNDIGAFYKNTDIGYCRFIFYCGIIGLLMFSAFFVKVTTMCAELFPKRKLCLFFLLLTIFIVWGKVATDNFPVFALLFFTDQDKEEEPVLTTNITHANNL